MATPKIIADFETQLNSAISIGDTSFTLSSATDDDGVALPAGLYYFTVENGSANKEYLAGTLSGTTVSSVVTVSRQGVETSGAARAHRIGSSVIMSDFLTYKKYMDEIALVSAPDASTTVKGVFEAATLAEVRAGTATGSTGAALATTPDVLDDLPTEDEKAALAGTGGSPSDSNRYITEDGTSNSTTGNTVFRFEDGQGVNKKLAVTAANTQVGASSTSEEDIVSVTVPANILKTANAIRIKAYTSVFDKTAGQSCTLRLKYGASTLATVSLASGGGGAVDVNKGILEAVLFANGASAQRGTMQFDISEDQNAINEEYGNATSTTFVRLFDTGVSAEDSTTELDLKLTVQYGNSSASNGFTLAGATTELIS